MNVIEWNVFDKDRGRSSCKKKIREKRAMITTLMRRKWTKNEKWKMENDPSGWVFNSLSAQNQTMRKSIIIVCHCVGGERKNTKIFPIVAAGGDDGHFLLLQFMLHKTKIKFFWNIFRKENTAKMKIRSSSRWKMTDKNVVSHMAGVRRWMNFHFLRTVRIFLVMCRFSNAHQRVSLFVEEILFSHRLSEKKFRSSAIFSP